MKTISFRDLPEHIKQALRETQVGMMYKSIHQIGKDVLIKLDFATVNLASLSAFQKILDRELIYLEIKGKTLAINIIL